MSPVCKCCGQTMPPKLELGIKLTPGYQRIVDAVHAAGPRGLQSTRLFNILYDGARDGGPEGGMKVMHVRIWHLNQRLKKVNLRVKGEHTGHNEYGFYRLLKLDEHVV